jgi:hypothetical protein
MPEVPQQQRIAQHQDQDSIARTRPQRSRRQTDHGPFVASLLSASPGLIIKISQALTDPEWKQSMVEEIDKLNKYETWAPVQVIPAGHKKLPLLWIFKEKANLTKKSRLTVRGDLEPISPDVINYAPVATLQARRMLLHMATVYDWGVCLVDIESAFVNAPLKKIVFVGIPPGFRDYFPKGTVGLKLLRSLYGLRSSPANWNSAFDTCLISFGFRRTKSDPCVYVFVGVDGRLILSLHVDDALIASSSKEVKSIFLAYLRQFFTIKLEDPVKRVLGTNLVRTAKGFTLHMRDYTEKLLQAYGFLQPKPNKEITPMSFNFMQELADLALRQEQNGPQSVQIKSDEVPEDNGFPYRELIGSLSFLAREGRPDIEYAVNVLARFNNIGSFSEFHVKAAKRILRYLRQTLDYSLLITAGEKDQMVLTAQSDSDWGSDYTTRRSTSGFIIKLGGSILLWKSRRQASLAHSSTDGEYMAATSAAKEIIYLRGLLVEMNSTPTLSPKLSPSTIYVDNSAVLALATGARNKRTKHIAIRMQALADWVASGQIRLLHVSTADNHADILTKSSITLESFKGHVLAIMERF